MSRKRRSKYSLHDRALDLADGKLSARMGRLPRGYKPAVWCEEHQQHGCWCVEMKAQIDTMLTNTVGEPTTAGD